MKFSGSIELQEIRKSAFDSVGTYLINDGIVYRILVFHFCRSGRV